MAGSSDRYHEQVRRSRERLDALQRAREIPTARGPEAELEDVRESIETLYIALEELRVAEEELRVQNEQLELAQEEAALDRQRFLELFQLAPDPYLVTTVEGTIVDANYAASALSGIPVDRLRGKPLGALVEPEARRTFRSVLAHALPLGRLDDWEVRVRPRGEGSAVDVSCSVSVVNDEQGNPASLRWILRDISERRRAERTARALAREEAAHAEAEAGRARLQGVLESISDAFVGVDSAWNITWVNRRAAEMWHRSREQLRGRALWRELSSAVGTEPHAALLRAMDTRERVERETRFPIGRRWIELRAYPAEEGGMSIFFRDITTRRENEAERQRLLAEAQAQRALLTTALHNLPGGVFIAQAPDGRIMLHNAEAERILAHPLHQEGGLDSLPRHYGILLPDGTPAPARDYPLFRALHGQTVRDEELGCRLGTGEVAILRCSAAPVHDPDGNVVAAVCTFSDITESLRIERTDRFLAEAGEVLSSSLNASEVVQQLARVCAGTIADFAIVHLLDDERGIRATGVAHADRTRQELLLGLLRRFPLAPDPEVHPVVMAIRTGRPELMPTVDETVMARVCGGPDHREMMRALGVSSAMVVPLRVKDQVLGVISLARGGGASYGARDLGAAEELARRAALALENARLYEQAQAAVRARDDVMAVVSHDLRNPINAVVMASAVLQEFGDTTRLTERDRKQLDVIRRSAEQMNALVQDLLEVASLESGAMVMSPRAVQPLVLLSAADEMFAGVAQERGLELQCIRPDGTPAVSADYGRVLQVLSNLLGNAFKFTPSGGRVSLSAARAAGYVRFWVTDTGPGIERDHLPLLFDRFWQARRGHGAGAGLGLAIARSIVEAHGGQIWAESTLGEGTTFHFTLPVAQPGE